MKLRSGKKHSFSGIGAKTTISHVAVAVVIVLFASILMYALMFMYVKSYVKAELLSDAMAISELESGQQEHEYNSDRVLFYEKMCDASVVFFDREYAASGYSLADGDTLHEEMFVSLADYGNIQSILILDAIDRYFLTSILSGTAISDIRTFQFVSGEIIFAGAPIYGENGEVVYGVMLMQSLDVFHEQASLLLKLILMIGAVALPVSVLISWVYATKLTRPLVEISKGAQLMAEGNFSERIVQETNDEIGDIANSLNSLSGRLRHTIGSLRRERDMLDLIMNGINEGIIAVDWYMHTVHCNGSFLRMLEMERQPEEVSLDSPYGGIMKASMRSNDMERIVWTDASGHRLMAVASSLHSGEGIVIGSVCLVQDISEVERMEQMRRDYVANVSHELRTPLTGIRGMVEPLMDGVFETEEEKQSCYAVIYKETIRLEKLIRDMLDMSKLQDGRLSIELEPVEIMGVIDDSLRRVSATAANAGVSLKTELPENPERFICIGNEDRMLQVLTIFLDNALSFTPAGGTVTVYVRRIGANLRMGVRDTGCGIEPKDLPYIWERFYKVDKSRMRTSGTGLGLAIAKLLAELMHGSVGVNSEPGVGADFWLELPLGEPDDEQ